jgi:hypothetical protein
MTEAMPDIVPCRLCAEPVARDAKTCPACGVKEPWIPDEPTINPRLIRVAMWGGGVVVLGLLLFLVALMMFGPRAEENERDHRPPASTRESR